MVAESNMGFGPSLQLCFLDKGRTGDNAGFLAGNISISSSEPLLWVLLRLRSSLILVEMNRIMGPREGRHAGGDGEGHDISRPPF